MHEPTELLVFVICLTYIPILLAIELFDSPTLRMIKKQNDITDTLRLTNSKNKLDMKQYDIGKESYIPMCK
jgi:hypothetical protein